MPNLDNSRMLIELSARLSIKSRVAANDGASLRSIAWLVKSRLK